MLRATLFLLLLSISWRAWFTVASTEAESVLIRPLYVYKGLIKGVHDYFNNTCVILFHGSSNSVEKEALDKMDELLALQKYFSGSLSVRTSIMDFRMFKNQVGKTYNQIKRPLFVLLNDLDDIRRQFALVSKWIAMAYPTWLLFLRNGTRFEDFLSNVHVPFDCILMVAQQNSEETGEIVRDVYRISNEDDLRSMRFGAWNVVQGFQGPGLGLYQRRHDLHGRNIRIVSIHDPPISRIVRDVTGRVLGISGFFGEVLQLLKEGINCTFTYKETGSWGVQLKNGTWTGAINKLVEDEADLAATELIMTSDRLDAVKFTTPVYTTKSRVYIKRPDSTAVKWNAYLAPFASNVWNAIALTIVIATLAIAAIDAFSRQFYWFLTDCSSHPSTLSEIVFLVFGAFCGQGLGQSSLDPIRLVHLSVHLTAVVVLSAYSAALISYLAIKTFAMPFTTMEGLLKDGTYRFSVVGDSADYSFFQNTSDPVLSVMFEELLTKEKNLPVNYLDGLKRVCHEDKYAFMTLDNMAAVLQARGLDCAIEPLDVMMQATTAMAVPIGSPYRGIIDNHILLLRDSGILQRLLMNEWTRNVHRMNSGWSSVELEDAMPLLIFLFCAFLVTCLVLLMERLVKRNRGQVRVTKQRSNANKSHR